jgi:hypothetical protein
MDFNTFILALLLGAVVFGQIAHYSSIGKLKTLRKKFLVLSTKDIAANVIWFCICAVMVFYSIGKVVDGVSEEYRTFGQVILLVIMLTVIVLIFSEYNLYDFIKKRWKIVTPIASFLGVVFTMYVNVYVDSEIFRYTQLNAINFPNAQNLIFFFLAPFFASLFSLYALLVFYFGHAFLIFIKQARNVNYFNNLIRTTVYVTRGTKIGEKQGFDEKVDLALLIGLVVFILTMPNLLSGLVSDKQLNLNKLIADTLVFSSYHVKGHKSCANILDESIIISFIKNNQISAVKPIEDKSYQFFVDNCVRKKEFKLPSA